MSEKFNYSACSLEGDNKAARVDAARAMGFPDEGAEDIQIIDGIPEYRPKAKRPQSSEPLPPPSRIDLIP